eukprot:TRINITY_DN2537_c0_g1_i3.p1 TRINITY_DN2537_c0_g1~~TRINITY_DN2537_c0_g1_i3.p1  ORF type:complete len:316 (-),score=78.45 TRINITY_DN2537_c0_g1_i3:1096-2043(-)
MNSAPQRDRDRRNQQLMQQINDMLLAAGYFRARISGLDDFDKVVWVAWIDIGRILLVDSRSELCYRYRVPRRPHHGTKNVPILTMNSKLSERVVKALEAMKCPSRIYPHQIQGLDYEKILPVVKWLVKILHESRDIRSEVNRKQAEYSYALSYQSKLPEAVESGLTPSKLQQKLTGPRLFKRKNIYDIELRDPKRIYSTLLEFNDSVSKEYYRKLIEAYDDKGGQKAKGRVAESVYIKKDSAGAGEESFFGGRVGMSKEKLEESHEKSNEAMAKLEGEVEKISEQEGMVKGENIGRLFMENIQNITDTVAEYLLP